MRLYRNGGGMKFDMTPPEKRDDASMVVPGLDWLPETTVTGLANFGEEDEDGEMEALAIDFEEFEEAMWSIDATESGASREQTLHVWRNRLLLLWQPIWDDPQW